MEILMKELHQFDPEIASLIQKDAHRQQDQLRMIPSENYVSDAVMQASGTPLTNHYSEGYPNKRYYQGQLDVDPIESLAIERAKKLFGAEHANVQPYSGSPANLAVWSAFLKPGDTLMGLSLPHGGHLTHGWNVSITGKMFKAAQYVVDPKTHLIDMAEVRKAAKEHKPGVLIAGATAYPRIIDFEAFAEIAKEVGAKFVADIAHIAGLVAAGVHPSPVKVADACTSSTHKTLRGPRSGLILCKQEHAAAIDRAVFPGLQGGPHDHTTAALAVALKEALQPSFIEYSKQIVANAKALADALIAKGFDLVTGGTDNHLILIDLSEKNVPGKVAAQALEKAGIVCNANTVPYDKRKPFDPSGIRLGTPSITSRGLTTKEMPHIAEWISQVVAAPQDEAVLSRVANEIKTLCQSFPAPGVRHFL
jgi:glycine hydroxymethyltransferase